jgi:subtilase family serine protease
MFGNWKRSRREISVLEPSWRGRRLGLEELEPRHLPSAYTPAQIAHVYGFDRVSFGGIRGDGWGETIALVVAYTAPHLHSDLGAFSAKYHLPQLDGRPGDPTLRVADLSGGTTDPTGGDWQTETALDVEWAHAIAPRANLLLVQAASDVLDDSGNPTDLLAAVDYAASQPGVVAVSMSWSVPEFAGEVSQDSHFVKKGVTFVAASGDNGPPPVWPAISPNVLAVGGTALNADTFGNYGSESGWGAGSQSISSGAAAVA